MGDYFDRLKYGQAYVNQKNMIRFCICAPPLIILIVVLNIYRFPPGFQVKQVYIPALDKSLNASTNASIVFDLSFRNREGLSNVYYDPINVTFYDSPNRNHSIANFTIPAFSQKECEIKGGKLKNEAVKSGAVNATGLDLEGAKREMAANGFKVFHVSLETWLRYDCYAFWKTKRYAYRRGADVKIGDTATGAANLGNQISIWSTLTLVGPVIMFLSADNTYLFSLS